VTALHLLTHDLAGPLAAGSARLLFDSGATRKALNLDALMGELTTAATPSKAAHNTRSQRRPWATAALFGIDVADTIGGAR
jgi:hypothetical protein